MSAAYEEIIEGETLLRQPPETRHEEICARLHAGVAESILGGTTNRRLGARSIVQFSAGTFLRPDLTLLTTDDNKPWLVAEVLSPRDHRPDTVLKKEFYERLRVPRLWMIDPRYDNIEVYHGSPYGLALRGILAQRDILTDKLIPSLQLSVAALFGIPHPDKALARSKDRGTFLRE